MITAQFINSLKGKPNLQTFLTTNADLVNIVLQEHLKYTANVANGYQTITIAEYYGESDGKVNLFVDEPSPWLKEITKALGEEVVNLVGETISDMHIEELISTFMSRLSSDDEWKISSLMPIEAEERASYVFGNAVNDKMRTKLVAHLEAVEAIADRFPGDNPPLHLEDEDASLHSLYFGKNKEYLRGGLLQEMILDLFNYMVKKPTDDPITGEIKEAMQLPVLDAIPALADIIARTEELVGIATAIETTNQNYFAFATPSNAWLYPFVPNLSNIERT